MSNLTYRDLDWISLSKHLPKRVKDAHKHMFGHLLIVGGDYGMGGAVRMAAEGALRAGAGLVSVATRPEHVPIVNANRPEIMCHHVRDVDDLTPMLNKATVIVIGPGLGQTDWASALLTAVITSNKPCLLDADALNLLSQHPATLPHCVLTPHEGEAGRLLGCETGDIQEDRIVAARALQARYGAVIVLKGKGTIVVDGQAHLPGVCHAGNPGMASAGMGDVLSGVIGSLMAQGIAPVTAAEIGVMAHAMAADLAAAEGGERGLLASDLMSHIRRLVNPA